MLADAAGGSGPVEAPGNPDGSGAVGGPAESLVVQPLPFDGTQNDPEPESDANEGTGEAPDQLEILPPNLGDACRGEVFFARFEARGGGGNYNWLVVSGELPDGLTLSPVGELTGVVQDATPGAYELDVSAKGSIGPARVVRVTLEVRQSCALAFVAGAEAREDLYLADVRARPEPNDPPENLTHGMPPGYRVDSFRFSPDGLRLALLARPVAGAGRSQLRLAAVRDLATGIDPGLDTRLPASWGEQMADVVDYAWSDDSHALAVMARLEGSAELSIRSADGLHLGSTDALYISNLFWVGSRACFVGSAPSGRVCVHCHRVEAGGPIASPELYYENFAAAFANAHLQGFDGFFVLSSPVFGATILQRIGDSVANDLGGAMLSPNLGWLGNVPDYFFGDGGLAVYPVTDGVVDLSGRAVVPACEVVLAWSEDGRFLSCASDGGITLVELDGNGQIVEARALDGLDHAPLRRAFSRAGPDGSSWYAFASLDAALRVVSLGKRPWMVDVLDDRVLDMPLGATFAFRGDRGELIYQLGEELRHVSTDGDFNRVVSTTALSLPLPCEDSHLYPREWCGGGTPPQSFALSPDATTLAAVDQMGVVQRLDLRGDGRLTPFVGVGTAQCARGPVGCADQMAFAP